MALEDHRIGFIGGGNMAEAIVRGLITARRMPPPAVYVSDVRSERLALFSSIGVNALPDNTRLVSEVDVLVLSIKPQVMYDVLAELKPRIDVETLVISIAAGIKTRSIEKRLCAGVRVVRVMPNTPLLVGKGISAIVRGANAASEDVVLASEVFAASGEVVLLDNENLMDAVTAVSGSGPAYVFYLAEAMLEAARAEGLPEDAAEKLVRHTILGAGAMLTNLVSVPPVQMRRQVTSPGGTTEAAVGVMDAAAVKETLVRAVRFAAKRSRELGGRD